MDFSSTKMKAIIAVIVIITLISVAVVYNYYKHRDDEEDPFIPETVEDGDTVKVDYTGYLDEPDTTGKVFDTTNLTIFNDGSIEKVRNFPEVISSSTLVAGESSPTEGFSTGLIGLETNTTTWIEVQPEKGYGAYHHELLLQIPLREEIPVYQVMDKSDFLLDFGITEEFLVKQASAVHPFWGWNITVLDVRDDSVEFWNMPDEGAEVGNFPWKSTIDEVSTLTIYVQHHVNSDDVDTSVDPDAIRTYDRRSITDLSEKWTEFDLHGSLKNGVVTTVAGSITVDFNLETAGRTLFYQVTVLEIISVS